MLSYYHFYRVNIDKNLYLKFWSLQDYFRNPNQCYKTEHWKLFVSVSYCNFELSNIVTIAKNQVFIV